MPHSEARLDDEPAGASRFVILRDLAIFGIKVLLDGLKDVVIIQIAVVAAGLDILFPTRPRGRRFYGIMRAGERFDQWLNLYGVIERARLEEQGLFEASMSGANNLLGKLEQMVTGRDERDAATRLREERERASRSRDRGDRH